MTGINIHNNNNIYNHSRIHSKKDWPRKGRRGFKHGGNKYNSYSIRIQTLTLQSKYSTQPVEYNIIQETSTWLTVSPGSVIALDTKESANLQVL